MTTDQKTAIRRFLELLIFLAENHNHAVKVWDELSRQLSMAALTATLTRSKAEGFLLSITTWASEEVPVRSSKLH